MARGADPLMAMAEESKATAPKSPPSSAKAAPDAKVDAIRDLFAAMKADDAEAGALAFERAYIACKEHNEEEAEDEGEGDYDLGG